MEAPQEFAHEYPSLPGSPLGSIRSLPRELSRVANTYSNMIPKCAFNWHRGRNQGVIMECALKAHHNIFNFSLVSDIKELHDESEVLIEDCVPKEILREIESIGESTYHVESLDYHTFVDTPPPLFFGGNEAALVSPHISARDQIKQRDGSVNLQVEQQYVLSHLASQQQPPVMNAGTVLFNGNIPLNHDNNLHQNVNDTLAPPKFTFPTGPATLAPLQTANEESSSLAAEPENFSLTSEVSYQTISWEFFEICERIWRQNDQKASLVLQDRIRACIPGEYEILVNIIHEQTPMLMVHRFGNFLVQCMLATAKVDDIERFAASIIGKVPELATNQFCCHVIQKLLEVGSLVVQARVASELLDKVYDTMTSPFGTHVWQKLLQLPWSKKLPPLGSMTHNAVHIQIPENGWVSIAQTDAGCSSIRSYLCLNQKESAGCASDLLDGLHELMTCAVNTSPVICKLAMLNSTRARTMALIFSRAYEYSRHNTGSEVLINLLRLKIPSFPARFSAAITSYRLRMQQDKNASAVLEALSSAQGAAKN